MQNLRHILLAEDNEHDIELTLNALTSGNIANEVVVVHDGVQVMDYLYRRNAYQSRNNEPPAVILLDLKMPKLDGLEVLRLIKSDPDLKTTPVVMLTSSREEQDLVRSYQLGVNAYVVKPVDFSQFVKAIKELGAFWAILNEVPVTHTKAKLAA